MSRSKELEHKKIVILLNVKKGEEAIYKCNKIISEQLPSYLVDGWQPSVPVDFDYLEKNGHVATQNKENMKKTLGLNTILFFITSWFLSLAVGVTDIIYDSVTIPLSRKVSD